MTIPPSKEAPVGGGRSEFRLIPFDPNEPKIKQPLYFPV